MAAPIERKAYAAPAATFVATQALLVVFTFWPAAAQAITPDQQLALVSIVATVLTAAAGYYTRHTHRPDLPPVVAAPPQPQPANVPVLPTRRVLPPAPPPGGSS